MDDRLATLVPQPRTIRTDVGQLALAAPPPVRAGHGGATAVAAAAAVGRVLAAIPWPAVDAHDGPAGVDVNVDEREQPEHYRLAITPDGVLITAGGPAGAFYAAQTLRQLLPDDAWRAAWPSATGSGASWVLPCATIDRRSRAVLAGRAHRRGQALLHQARAARADRRAGRAQAQPAAPASDRRPGLAGREPSVPRPARDRLASAADPDQPQHRAAEGVRGHPARRLLHARRPGRDHRATRPTG